jgi:hypothetical protein
MLLVAENSIFTVFSSWTFQCTSINVHPYLRDARSSSLAHLRSASLLLNTICCTSLETWRVSGPLQWSLPSAVTHLQSLTTGLCPGTQQFTYFRRLSTNTNSCVRLCLCNSFQNQALLRANEVLLGSCFFLTLDGSLIICSCQSSQFQLLCTSLLTFIGSYFVEIFSDNWQLLFQKQSSLVKFSIFCFFFLLPVCSFQSVIQ